MKKTFAICILFLTIVTISLGLFLKIFLPDILKNQLTNLKTNLESKKSSLPKDKNKSIKPLGQILPDILPVDVDILIKIILVKIKLIKINQLKIILFLVLIMELFKN